jgi:flagellar assembly protein FliH
MRSLSKLVKSSQIIIDKKKYVLTHEYFSPKDESDDDVKESKKELLTDEKRHAYFDELRQMKEEMLEEVKQNADNLLSSAEEEKNKLIQDGYAQAEGVKNDAQNSGYEAGYEAGVAKGYDEVSHLIEELLEQKSKYQEKYNQIKEESEEAITHIILETVETILNKRIEEDESMIQGLVKKALEKCAFTSNLTLRVAPEDYDNAVSLERYILSLTENVEHIEIKQDNALKPGSCIFDTDAGSVDSGVLTQYKKVQQKFIELLKSE